MAPGIQKALPQSPKVKPSTPQHTSARAGAQKKMPPLALAGEKKPLLTAKTIASLTPPQKRVELLGLRGWYLASLVLVYAMSVVTNLITYILKPTMLLYTNEQGWTSKEDTKFYTMLMVITSVLPIMLNPVVTKWVDARSSKEVFIFMPLLCALGLALMLVQNKWLYFTGMSLTSGILCLRAARQAWILGAVPAAHTSRATLTLAVSFPIGSLLGPLVAVGVSRCWPHADLVYSYTVAGGYAVILSRYTVVYLVCFLIMSAQVLLVSFIFKDTCQDDSVSVISSLYYCPGQEPPVSPRSRLSSYSSTLQRSFASFERSKSASGHDEMNAAAAAAAHAQATVEALSKEDSELKSSSRSRTASSARGSYGRLGKRKEMPTNAKRAPMWEGYVTAEDHNRRVVTIHSSTYAFRMFLFFSVMTFSTNVTTGVFNQVLNPVLVNHFHLEFGAVSLVTTFHKVCALVASLVTIPLAKHGQDVNLMVVGLTLMLTGSVLFSVVPTQLPLVIIGSALLEQGSTFFLAISVALLSKLLGRRMQGFSFGVFSSMLMLGKGCSTVLGGWTLHVGVVGTWYLLLWGLPAVGVFLALLQPRVRRYLDHDRPLVKAFNNPEPPNSESLESSLDAIFVDKKAACVVM